MSGRISRVNRTDIISRPTPDKVRGQRTEDLGEYFTVPPSSIIPQFVCVRGERIGNEIIIVSPEFVLIQDGSRTHGWSDFWVPTIAGLRWDQTKML